MGDRGNVAVVQPNGSRVYLYTHWGGSGLAVRLCDALASDAGRLRWDDPSYLTRIIFNEMQKGCHSQETGFGISTSPPDNEHPFLVVGCCMQSVTVEDNEEGRFRERLHVGDQWSFEEYVNLPGETLVRIGAYPDSEA